jgi:ATP-binding cassette subfamily B protein
MRTVFSYAFNNCCALFLGFLALIVGSFANFAVPGLIGLVVTAMEKYDWHSVNVYCLYMLGIVIVSGIGAGFRGSIFNTTSEQIARQIRYDLFYFLIRKDVAYFDDTKTGEILSRLSTDTQII